MQNVAFFTLAKNKEKASQPSSAVLLGYKAIMEMRGVEPFGNGSTEPVSRLKVIFLS